LEPINVQTPGLGSSLEIGSAESFLLKVSDSFDLAAVPPFQSVCQAGSAA
jgi:hypothetical protein